MVRHVRAAISTMLVLLVAAGASGCASSGGARAADGSAAGASTARESVVAFMDAVKRQDLQAMGTYWGTTKGPARDQMSREDLEKRTIIMQCHFENDSWRFVEANPRLKAGKRQEFLVEIRKKAQKAQTTFTTVQGPQERWYVEIADIVPLREFCR